MLMKIVIIKVSFQLLILCISVNIFNTFQLDFSFNCFRFFFFHATIIFNSITFFLTKYEKYEVNIEPKNVKLIY